MLNAHDLPREVLDRWSDALGVHNLKVPDWSDDRLVGQVGGNHVTVLLRVVGPDYSGTYRDWATLRKGDRMAALAGRPAGVKIVYAMVGLAPDGRVWWTTLYDEDRLPVGDAESLLNDRFYRLMPSQAKDALIDRFDFIQPELGLDTSGGPESARQTVPLQTVPVGARVQIEGVVTRHNSGGSVTLEYETGKRWAILGLTPVTVLA